MGRGKKRIGEDWRGEGCGDWNVVWSLWILGNFYSIQCLFFLYTLVGQYLGYGDKCKFPSYNLRKIVIVTRSSVP